MRSLATWGLSHQRPMPSRPIPPRPPQSPLHRWTIWLHRGRRIASAVLREAGGSGCESRVLPEAASSRPTWLTLKLPVSPDAAVPSRAISFALVRHVNVRLCIRSLDQGLSGPHAFPSKLARFPIPRWNPRRPNRCNGAIASGTASDTSLSTWSRRASS